MKDKHTVQFCPSTEGLKEENKKNNNTEGLEAVSSINVRPWIKPAKTGQSPENGCGQIVTGEHGTVQHGSGFTVSHNRRLVVTSAKVVFDEKGSIKWPLKFLRESQNINEGTYIRAVVYNKDYNNIYSDYVVCILEKESKHGLDFDFNYKNLTSGTAIDTFGYPGENGTELMKAHCLLADCKKMVLKSAYYSCQDDLEKRIAGSPWLVDKENKVVGIQSQVNEGILYSSLTSANHQEFTDLMDKATKYIDGVDYAIKNNLICITTTDLSGNKVLADGDVINMTVGKTENKTLITLNLHASNDKAIYRDNGNTLLRGSEGCSCLPKYLNEYLVFGVVSGQKKYCLIDSKEFKTSHSYNFDWK